MTSDYSINTFHTTTQYNVPGTWIVTTTDHVSGGICMQYQPTANDTVTKVPEVIHYHEHVAIDYDLLADKIAERLKRKEV